MADKHVEDLTIADGLPFAVHQITGAIGFIERHRQRCGKSFDLAGIRQDLTASLAALDGERVAQPGVGSLSPSRQARVLPANARPVIAQVGWLGATGVVYALDDHPSDGREPGSVSPLYICVGTWEDLGDGKWGIKD